MKQMRQFYRQALWQMFRAVMVISALVMIASLFYDGAPHPEQRWLVWRIVRGIW